MLNTLKLAMSQVTLNNEFNWIHTIDKARNQEPGGSTTVDRLGQCVGYPLYDYSSNHSEETKCEVPQGKKFIFYFILTRPKEKIVDCYLALLKHNLKSYYTFSTLSMLDYNIYHQIIQYFLVKYLVC